jgi:transcriptional regulator with PAS, ATPase and Fis domain
LDKRTDDISRQLRVFITTFQADVRRLAKASERDQQLAAALEPAEAAHIRRALSACGGNKSQAARLLQIDRRSLQRKLVRLTSPKAKKKPAAKKPAKRRR